MKIFCLKNANFYYCMLFEKNINFKNVFKVTKTSICVFQESKNHKKALRTFAKNAKKMLI